MADAAKLLFDRGDEFAIDGFAVGAHVGGIDGVGIVVIRIRVLHQQEQHAGELAGGPVLVKLVLSLGAFEGIAGHAGLGRRGAEAGEVAGKMAVIYEERIVGVGMGGPAFGDHDDSPEVHRTTPELRERLALNADVFHQFGVFGCLDGRDDFGEMDLVTLAFGAAGSMWTRSGVL